VSEAAFVQLGRTPLGKIARRQVNATRDGPVLVVDGAVSIQGTAFGTGGPQTATAVSTRAVFAESRTRTTARYPEVREDKPTPETWAREETFVSGKRGQVYLHNAASESFPRDIIDLAAES
jgi:hypothetical protein